MSRIIANEHPVDYSGFLCLESNVDELKTKQKPRNSKRSQKVKTCEAVPETVNVARGFESTNGKAKQDKKSNSYSRDTNNRVRSIRNPEDEYGIINELAQKVKILERHQTQATQKMQGEIEQLTRKVSDAEYRNIVLDVEINLLKNQLNHQAGVMQKLLQLQKISISDEDKASAKRRAPR